MFFSIIGGKKCKGGGGPFIRQRVRGTVPGGSLARGEKIGTYKVLPRGNGSAHSRLKTSAPQKKISDVGDCGPQESAHRVRGGETKFTGEKKQNSWKRCTEKTKTPTLREKK